MSLAGTVDPLRRLGPFGVVLDVGGNVGEWASLARDLWPDARLTSFEPVPYLAQENAKRSEGRWWVEPVALSDQAGQVPLDVCLNQHSASSMHAAGTVRRERFGLVDRRETIEVEAKRLDDYLDELPAGRLLVKIDVEGHEGAVIVGGARLLGERADAVVVEVQNSPDVFAGAFAPRVVDELLDYCGLHFAGVLGCLADPSGEVMQFDAIYTRR